MKLTKLLALSGAMAVSLGAGSANALTIELRNIGGVTPGTNAYAGFTAAAHFWETVITNNVNVKLNVGFGALGPGILGSTGSTTNVALIEPTLNALANNGNSALDAIATANLPTPHASPFGEGAGAVDALISGPRADGTGVALPLQRVLDADGSGNNVAFSANTSLLKALGITPTYTGANAAIMADGSVTFSNAFAFDFDPTNGIDADKIDFIGVAIHEIGHALGFRSGVDVYDANTGFTGNLGGFAIMSIWDIFRYSQQSAALGVNDWAVGGTIAGGTRAYFSIDGGASIYNGDAYLSTGRVNGDGRQASHWLDKPTGTPQLGILDPTVAFGQQSVVTSLDLAAYDAMGWNIRYDVMRYGGKDFSTRVVPNIDAYVPEPATWAMLVGGFFLLGGAMRSRRGRVALVRA